MIESPTMNLVAIAIGAIGVLLMAHSISRQSLIRALARELRAIREREHEQRIRFDDLAAKVNNSLVHVSKITSMYDKRIANLEDRLNRSAPQEKLFQLESDADHEMRERLQRLEQLALSGSSAAPSENHTTPSQGTGDHPPASGTISEPPAVSVPLNTALLPWNEAIERDLQSIVSQEQGSAKKLSDALQKSFRAHHLDGLIDGELTDQVATVFSQKNGSSTHSRVDRDFLADALQQSLQAKLKPAKPFDCKSREADGKLRTLLLVGPDEVGKTSVAVGIARVLQREGAKVLLADCSGGVSRQSTALSQRHRDGDLEVVAPLINTKPHHVAYKAIHRAQDEGFSVVLLDTPSALTSRNKVSPEVTSIASMIAREHPHPPHETVMVLDASQPKDAISRGKALLAEGAFSGLTLTHLDALPHPGAVLEIVSALKIPLWFVSYGSSEREFCPFDSVQFSRLLFGGVEKEPAPAQEHTSAPAALGTENASTSSFS